ncbi:hypothetical protein ACXR0O_18385 [Verrucomicrobiota bacterium sgz303538]
MSANRRRHANILPIASWATWILLALFVAGAGLYYVYCKNQLHTRGSQIKILEKELAELQNQNEVVQARIAMLSSPNALKTRREQDKSFLADYTEITRDRLVLMSDRVVPNSTSELRAVANNQP